MEGNAFLFRIPNASTRARVLAQRLWSIEGQTMFVTDWETGVVPMNPELKSAPIWLELRNVPLQFFNDEGLEHIASLVGDPKFLHPSTANKTNLEVAKIFIIIDPRKPLPEVVNVKFQSGEIRRVDVASPWMPQICSHCKESISSRIAVDSGVQEEEHLFLEKCTRPSSKQKVNQNLHFQKKQGGVPKGQYVAVTKKADKSSVPPPQKDKSIASNADGNYYNQTLIGESSAMAPVSKNLLSEKLKAKVTSPPCSDADPDSSDVESSDSQEEGELRDKEDDFIGVLSRRKHRNPRDKGPKKH
ncbi:uncharacterized protein LOC112086551 [Eutrema salsugineum]|uniref:uncharacterized protein LOC112086551 n=1 Tax=Eutrema salsugineum TaxID=72664 RepID=UPI000CED3DFC|nr:uncharacterized protein LOC112086551 [Eutrema salsugineum]